MGAKDSKEENKSEVHGNQLLTVINAQNEHSEQHAEHHTMLIVLICLLVGIIVWQLTRIVLRCLKKRYVKKGMKAAESLGSIANV